MRSVIIAALLVLPLHAAPLNVSAVTWNAASPGDVAIETTPASGPVRVSIFANDHLILRDGTLAQALVLARSEGVLP